MNKTILIGNLTDKAESKQIGENTLHTFTVATSERWTDKQGNKKENTQFHNCKMWNKNGVTPFLIKGAKVAVEGQIEYSKTETEPIKYFTNIKVMSLELVGGNKTSTTPQEVKQGAAPNPVNESDDLPF